MSTGRREQGAGDEADGNAAHCLSQPQAQLDRLPLDSEWIQTHDSIEVFLSTGYVEQREGVYMVSGTRISLDSIVYAFLAGESAESVAQAFPVLTLEQVYGAMAFSLAHRQDVDDYLATRRRDFDAKREAARDADPMFYQKLTRAKRQTPLAR